MATIRKKKTPGGWKYVLDYRDAHGLRHKPEYATRGEAADAQKDLVPTRAQRRGGVGCDPRLTFREWGTTWLASIESQLKPTAYEVHRRALHVHLFPRIGDVRLVELRRGVILDALIDCQKCGGFDPRTKEPRPLKPGSVRTIYSAVRACLQSAVDREKLPANPAAKLGGRGGLRCEPTKQERIKRIKFRIRRADEMATLAVYTKQAAPRWLPLLLTYCRAGLRLGEGIALEVDDFSPVAGGSLRIRQALDYKTGRHLDDPKNGFRIVDLSGSPELVAVLKAQVAGLKKRAAATARIGRRWLFPTATGGTLLPRNVNRKIGELAGAAGLPGPCSPHDLRHSYATMLIESGAPAAYVQQQLGHASIQLTIDTYGATARPKLPGALVGLFDRGTPAADAGRETGGDQPGDQRSNG